MQQPGNRLRLLVLGITGLWLVAIALHSTLHAQAQTPVPTQATANQSRTIPAPDFPLRAWTVAPDGVPFVLDASARLYQLNPADLSPVARIGPLLPVSAAPNHLVADEAHIFAGSEAFTQTIVLQRADFYTITTINQAGAMAVDPGRHLFLIPQSLPDFQPYKWEIWIYDLTDLDQPPQSLPTGCLSGPPVIKPTIRRLYVQERSCMGSPPHQGDFYVIYDLDTLQEIGTFQPDPSRGYLERPAIAERTGRGFTINHGLSGSNDWYLFDRRGRIARTIQDITNATAPTLDASGRWLYLLYPHGLAVHRANDLSLQSYMPLTTPVTATLAADLALSPKNDLLYFFSPGKMAVYTTGDLQKMGVSPVQPFPLAWLQPDAPGRIKQVYLYPSPQQAKDATVFARVAEPPSRSAQIYRSRDGGHSWHPLPLLDKYGIGYLSISPDYATDQTVVADAWRSTDGGESWAYWQPRLAFVSDREGNREIYTMSMTSNAPGLRRLTNHPADDETPSWSPAWTRLAFQSNRTGNWEIFSLRAECDPDPFECDLQQLTNHPADDLLPAWSPDGRMIAFVSLRDGNAELYVMDSNGQNPRRLTFHPGGDWRPAWLPDSRRLVFTSDRNGSNDIYMLTVPAPDAPAATEEPPLTPIITGPADDRDPAIGGSVALTPYFGFDEQGLLFFLSDRGGSMKTYVAKLDGSGAEPRVYNEAEQIEAHPSWFGEYYLLVAVGEGQESDIVALTPFTEPQALTTAAGFDGHPAGSPVWWQVEPAEDFAK